MKVIHIGGAKGVGKTTTLNSLSLLSIPGYSIKTITMSKVLFEIAEKEFGVKWPDLDESRRSESRQKIGAEILRLPCDIAILDSHYVDMKEGTPVPIVPEEIKKIIDVYMVLEAGELDIQERRLKDKGSRERELNLNFIKREIEAERAEAIRLSSEGAKPVYFVYNNSVSETANEILAITRNYLLNREREATDEVVIHHI